MSKWQRIENEHGVCYSKRFTRWDWLLDRLRIRRAFAGMPKEVTAARLMRLCQCGHTANAHKPRDGVWSCWSCDCPRFQRRDTSG